jgi:hypothetical protein
MNVYLVLMNNKNGSILWADTCLQLRKKRGEEPGTLFSFSQASLASSRPACVASWLSAHLLHHHKTFPSEVIPECSVLLPSSLTVHRLCPNGTESHTVERLIPATSQKSFSLSDLQPEVEQTLKPDRAVPINISCKADLEFV